MKKVEEHRHFFLGENKQWFPDEEFIVHMADPRCFIRFSNELAMFASYDEFYDGIAEVQWIDGKPSDKLIEKVLTNAWNFLAIEERILEDDIAEMEEFEDFDFEDEI